MEKDQDPLPGLQDLLPEELEELVVGMGQPRYRAAQILEWLYAKGVAEVEQMSNLPKTLRQQLEPLARRNRLRLLRRQESPTDQAVKFLMALDSGERVEAVLIADGRRRTACLSSQVGCPLDCGFCATGRMGFIRNLSAGQIVDQLVQLNAFAQERGERVTNVVLMGMGEPLLNYDSAVRALRLMCLEQGLALGGRRITLSTAGYLPGIRRLAREEGLNVGLAISLNATTDPVRERLMPINRRWKIAQLLEAAREFFRLRGRRVTFEYVLLEGVNDCEEDAVRLARLTRDVPCKINLIPYNELGPDTPFRRPDRERLERFYRRLEREARVSFTVRESRGRDIEAACGQLYQSQERWPGQPA